MLKTFVIILALLVAYLSLFHGTVVLGGAAYVVGGLLLLVLVGYVFFDFCDYRRQQQEFRTNLQYLQAVVTGQVDGRELWYTLSDLWGGVRGSSRGSRWLSKEKLQILTEMAIYAKMSDLRKEWANCHRDSKNGLPWLVQRIRRCQEEAARYKVADQQNFSAFVAEVEKASQTMSARRRVQKIVQQLADYEKSRAAAQAELVAAQAEVIKLEQAG